MTKKIIAISYKNILIEKVGSHIYICKDIAEECYTLPFEEIDILIEALNNVKEKWKDNG